MNPSQLFASTFDSRVDDARRRADASRRAAAKTHAGRRAPADPGVYAEHVVIRSAGPADRADLARLADLDGGRLPAGDVLVAELRGELVAAIGLDDGRDLAHPFRRSADVVSLLRMRAQQLRGTEAGDRNGGLPELVRNRVRALIGRPAAAAGSGPAVRHGSAPWVPGIRC